MLTGSPLCPVFREGHANIVHAENSIKIIFIWGHEPYDCGERVVMKHVHEHVQHHQNREVDWLFIMINISTCDASYRVNILPTTYRMALFTCRSLIKELWHPQGRPGQSQSCRFTSRDLRLFAGAWLAWQDRKPNLFGTGMIYRIKPPDVILIAVTTQVNFERRKEERIFVPNQKKENWILRQIMLLDAINIIAPASIVKTTQAHSSAKFNASLHSGPINCRKNAV